MTRKKLSARKDGFYFEIREDRSDVGWYLYIYKDGECIRDELQDTLEVCLQIAEEDYEVHRLEWVEE